SKDENFGICLQYGISEGTVYLYCKRVMLAIFSLKHELVIWPTGELRKMVHLRFNNIGGFNNVIDAIDDTHIILGIASLKQPKIYWNRKKKYSIQCQAIVDYCDVFIDYEIGWPESVYNAKLYRNSFFYQDISTLING
ncbi:775_t:CDS:1, partial [Funneliformis geosporum]